MGSDSPTILVAGVFERASAGGGEALPRENLGSRCRRSPGRPDWPEPDVVDPSPGLDDGGEQSVASSFIAGFAEGT